jgi:predicted restriction endonuclease
MQTDKLIEAIEIAKDIIDYCPGDAWERECTQEARDRFQEIYEELFPKQEQSPKNVISKYDWRCEICKITMPKGNRESHINGKKHKANAAPQNVEAVESIA